MPDVAAWYEARLRPHASAMAEHCEGGEWATLDQARSPALLAAAEARHRDASGASARVTGTMLAGWNAGYLATMIATAAIADGVVARLHEADGLEVLRSPEGWLADMTLTAVPVTVEADHRWAGEEGVTVVADLRGAAVAAIVAAGEPWITALIERSGRGRAGLWAQVPDFIAEVARALPDRLDEVEALLDAPNVPWRTRPRLWHSADALVIHRGSCCLYYRVEGAEYCAGCRFRTADDVEARAQALTGDG